MVRLWQWFEKDVAMGCWGFGRVRLGFDKASVRVWQGFGKGPGEGVADVCHCFGNVLRAFR